MSDWNTTIQAMNEAVMNTDPPRECTCHPDEAPVPCPRKHAWHECRIATLEARLAEAEARAEKAERERDEARDKVAELTVAGVQLREAYDQMNDSFMSANDEISAIEARLAEAERVIEPFARACSEIDDDTCADGIEVVHSRITAGDLRAAARFMEKRDD